MEQEKGKEKFLTNVIKDGNIPLWNFALFKYTVKIYGPSTLPNIVKSTKVLAKKMGYKNPKILIYDNATSATDESIKDICWAVYAEEQCEQ